MQLISFILFYMLLMDYIDNFTLLGAAGRETEDSDIRGPVINETASLGLTSTLDGKKDF